VVGVTVSADLTYAQRAFRAGAMFFLPKPVSATSLVCVVELAAGAASPGAPMRRRRRHPRFAAKVPVQCTIQSHGEVGRELMGQTENVSLAGLLLWHVVAACTRRCCQPLTVKLPAAPVLTPPTPPPIALGVSRT